MLALVYVSAFFTFTGEAEQLFGTALLELGLLGVTQGCLHLGVFSPTFLPLASGFGQRPWASSGDVLLPFTPRGLLSQGQRRGLALRDSPMHVPSATACVSSVLLPGVGWLGGIAAVSIGWEVGKRSPWTCCECSSAGSCNSRALCN